MSSPNNTIRGSFDYLLAIDCETTGLCFNSPTPVYNASTNERHQTVSWGIVVANAATLKPIEQLYVEIKWNKESKKQRNSNPEFGSAAEKIHRLTYNHLEKNGITETEAVERIGNIIIKHWGNTSIKTLGHNVHSFDLPFLRDLFERQGINLNFGSRHYDTNSIGFCTFGTFTSDELFETLGFKKRESHDSLADALMSLEAARRIRLIFQKALKL